MEIENNIPIPDKPKRRYKKRASKEKPHPAKRLLESIKFVTTIQKKSDSSEFTHLFISNYWCVGCNESITVGSKISEDLNCCPQTYPLLDALNQCKDEIKIVQDESLLTIHSGDFKAIIPCIQKDTIIPFLLNPISADYIVNNDTIKDIFKLLLPIIKDNSEKDYYNVIFFNTYTVVASNGRVLIEIIHNTQLPCCFTVSKDFVNSVIKSDKLIQRLNSYNNKTLFQFEDESFICENSSVKYPDYQSIFNCENQTPYPLPDDFFKGLKSIESFSNDGIVKFVTGGLQSDNAFYAINGLPVGISFLIKDLLSIEKCLVTIHFDMKDNKAIFYGIECRGVILATNNPEVNEIK